MISAASEMLSRFAGVSELRPPRSAYFAIRGVESGSPQAKSRAKRGI